MFCCVNGRFLMQLLVQCHGNILREIAENNSRAEIAFEMSS